MSELKPGDKVNYVPHADHWHNAGGAHFHFVHAELGPPRADNDNVRAKIGSRVEGEFGIFNPDDPNSYNAAHATKLGAVDSYDKATGIIRTSKGYAFKIDCCKAVWPAVVFLEPGFPAIPAVLYGPEDGNDLEGKPLAGREARAAVPAKPARLMLRFKHPAKPWELHEMPLDSVPHDPTGKTLHSYHVPEGQP